MNEKITGLGKALPPMPASFEEKVDAALQSLEGRKRPAGAKGGAIAAVAAAAACAVLLCVPAVRASVANLFGSALEYIAAPASERPAVEGVEVEKVCAGKAFYQTEKDGEWVRDVTIRIEEALYDGEKLYLKYVVDGSKAGMVTDDSALSEGVPVGGTYEKRDVWRGSVTFGGGYPVGDMRGRGESMEQGVLTQTAVYSVRAGTNFFDWYKAELTIEFATFTMTKVEEYGWEGDPTPAGSIAVPFTFHSSTSVKIEEGEAQTVLVGKAVCTDGLNQYFGNNLVTVERDYAGTRIFVKEMIIKPTEIGVTLEMEVPAGMNREQADSLLKSIDMKAYIDGREAEYQDIEKDSVYGYGMEDGQHTIRDLRLNIPFPESGARTLSLIPYVRYIESVDGKPVVLGARFDLDGMPEFAEHVFADSEMNVPLP